jgi:hypothetical protein
MLRSILLSGAVLLAGSGPDSVKLAKTGKVQEGRVVFEGKDEVVLRVNGKDQRIPRTDVAEIHSLERSLSVILDRDLKTADAASLAEIAKACEQASLDREARNFWLRVLLADSKSEAAAKALGAQVVKDEIRVPFGKEKRKIEELAKRQASWKEAYELPSTHFVLQTDLDLPFALDISLALERNYRRFYETLAQPLEMYVFDEDPEVYVYGRAADFPVGQVKGDTIWFAPGINRLNVLAEPEPSVRDVVHELTRMLLFNSMRRSAGATAQVPQWTAAGIAEIFAIAAPAERFGKWAEIGVPDAAAFAHAKSANVDLDRVFNAGINDFNGSAKRAEMIASAYSLVHYLVFGKDGALRVGYGKFLREGAKGKISIGALADALSLPKKEIESGWRAYVDANAR